MTLFDFLNEITYSKRPWEQFTEDEQSEFNIFMINRFISMNQDYIDVVQLIQSHPTLSPKLVYKYYCDLLPKRKSFFRYIKSQSKHEPEVIKSIAEYYQCSTREAKDYITLIDKQQLQNVINLREPGKKPKKNKKK